MHRVGGGKGGSHHEFTNNNFAFHESRNKYLRFHATRKYRSYKMSVKQSASIIF